MRRSLWVWFLVVLYFAVVSWALFHLTLAHAHEFYDGLKDEKRNQLCCGDNDCEPTHYRIEHGDTYAFLTRENHWVIIPKDHIVFLPVPGDNDWSKDTDPEHRAHLCYRISEDMGGRGPDNEFTSEDGQEFIHLYCAFIPPGSI